MSTQRVLVTGGAGTVGAAVVRRLLADAAFEVRVADRREAPVWIREGCEVHAGDLRDVNEARRAVAGCSHVVHLAGIAADPAQPHSTLEAAGLDAVVLRAALDHAIERFVYASTAELYERATVFPTPEEHLAECPAPGRAAAFAKLAGERLSRAAAEEHDLPLTICRLAAVYGPEGSDGAAGPASALNGVIRAAVAGERPVPLPGTAGQTCPPTHVADTAAGIVTALVHPAAGGETFNLVATRELSLEAVARSAWVVAGHDLADLAVSAGEPGPRLAPSPEKARRLLDWEAEIAFEAGVATTVAWLRETEAVVS